MDDSCAKAFTTELDTETILGILKREMTDLKETLVRIEEDNSHTVYSIRENINRVSNVFQTNVDKKLLIQSSSYSPIHDLLSVGPLTRTEIPLDLLDMLILEGWDVNSTVYFYSHKVTCLDIAVESRHYNAIRLLVVYHARSNSSNDISVEPPVTSLAAQRNVPLDLLDLLATPENLNNVSNDSFGLPLHTAAHCGHTATALHLIKLGANLDQRDRSSDLPIGCFLQNMKNQCNIHLFRRLLPKSGQMLCESIFSILVKGELDTNSTRLPEMFQQLLQRVHLDKPLYMEVRSIYGVVCINGSIMVNFCIKRSLHATYLLCLILVELQFDLAAIKCEIADESKQVEAVSELNYAQAVEDMLMNYHQNYRVKFLLRMCILCTRKSMRSLDDESFQSLPVPPYTRKQLSYHDVAEKIFEEWHKGLSTSS